MKKMARCVAMVCLMAQVAWGVGIGSTREEVIQTLGKPKGVMNLGRVEALTYDGGVIELEKGRVTYIDPKFDEKTLQAQREREYEKAQLAKGLVKYDGKWMTPIARDALEIEKRKQQELEEAKRKEQERLAAQQRARNQAAQRGQAVDLASLISPGSITIVDFYAEWCGPCKRLAPKLDQLAQDTPNVVLRKVDIGDWNSPVAQQYGISSVPHVRVYDRDGQMVGGPTSDFGAIAQFVSQAQ
jgi:thioredoxin 1